MSTVDRVINIRDNPRWREEPNTIYIGRANRSYKLSRSVFANPFTITPTRERDEAIKAFARWVPTSYKVLSALRALPLDEDYTFACWCAPAACHGDVLVALREQWRHD